MSYVPDWSIFGYPKLALPGWIGNPVPPMVPESPVKPDGDSVMLVEKRYSASVNTRQSDSGPVS
jgi:hypothetical protein